MNLILVTAATNLQQPVFSNMSISATGSHQEQATSGPGREIWHVNPEDLFSFFTSLLAHSSDLPDAVLFYQTGHEVLEKLSSFFESSHISLPVFFLPEAGTRPAVDVSDLPKSCVMLAQTDFESGAWVSLIRNVSRFSKYQVGRLRTEHFQSVARAARFYSHEIRNPLTNIDISAAELKSEREKQAVPLSPSPFLQFIEKNSRRINELLGVILQHTRTDELYPETIIVSEFVESLLASIATRFPETSFVAGPQEITELTADEEKLSAALYHLLENAAEAGSGMKGQVSLAITLTGQNILFTVTDTGPGISIQDSPMIFEPFFTRKIKSAGLGLSAARDIAERHKGSVRFYRNEQGMNSLCLCLPNPGAQS